MSRVDIVLPELARYDAVGVHTRTLRDLLEAQGHDVSVVVERVGDLASKTGDPDGVDDVLLLSEWRADADLTILQHAIGSMAAEEIVRRQVEVVVNYHNVTPHEYFEFWDFEQVAGLRWGREQLLELAPITRVGIAVSEFNVRDLRAAGMGCVEVAPVLVDDAVLPAGGVLASPGGGGDGSKSKVTLLFVGRLAPNKCQQDLVSALAVLQRWRADVELVLVGSSSADVYEAALRDFAVELGVGDAVRFVGSVSSAELAGWYRRADVFVCLSEHEGFCVPLVEAMAWGVPVVAAAAAAVPETLGAAGVLLTDKSPVVVAAAVERVLIDAGLRDDLVRRGLARASELGPRAARERLREILTRRRRLVTLMESMTSCCFQNGEQTLTDNPATRDRFDSKRLFPAVR